MVALSHRQLDRLSVVFSTVCLAHCVALPSIALAVPLGGLAFGTDWHFHGLMLTAIVPVSVVALTFGYRRHRLARVLLAGAIGLALLIAAATAVHDAGRTAVEAALTVAGSLLLALAHVVNLRAPRPEPAALPA